MNAGEGNWRQRAACHDEVDLFNTTFEQSYPPDTPDTASTRDARKVCASCKVDGECLMWALKVQAEFGIWAGMTPPERESLVPMVNRAKLDTPSAAAEMNTNSVRIAS